MRTKIKKRNLYYYIAMNEIGYVRKRLGLTQEEAASLLGVSRRTYQYYETDKNKVYTNNYKYALYLLNKENTIDEEHGVLKLEEIIRTCKKILSKYDVRSCYLFGSYAKNRPSGKSDVDLLIDTTVTGASFYGLIEELRVALSKKVDLLNLNQIVENKELLSEILKDGIKIYG